MSQHAGTPVPGHIVAWSKEPGPRRVLDDAFTRFERGQALSAGTCRVELTRAERRQVGLILPAPWAASTEAPLTWRALRAGLQANGTTLESVVAQHRGPWRNTLQDRRDARRAGERDHEQAREMLAALLMTRAGVAKLSEDTVKALARGLFGRRTSLCDADLIRRALEALPPAGTHVGLAVLAASVFGDAHALDRVSALGRAVARFVRLEGVVRSGEPDADAAATFTPQGWRATWAAVGVMCDQVSSQVLVLNLPLEGEAPAVAISTAAAGEPVWLTLRSLAGGLSIAKVPTVFVCENPSIIEAAADALGARSLPLICTFGRPSAAALQLLEAAGPGTVIRVQADADVTGRAIVAALVADHPQALPWRMPTAGVVYEEELVDELLADLGAG
ncbi:MAG: TIGR02679 domain-containing protein [Arachnia sp.]